MSEEIFADELTRRADDIHAAPLTVDTVRGRARQIRRRRRTGLAAGLAAAVAAVVLVPAALTGTGDDGGVDPAPAPALPGSAVLHDGTLTLPDKDPVPLPVDNADVAQLAVLDDGRAVLAMQEPYAVQVFAADGSLEATYPVQSNVITASADGEAVAWVGDDYYVRVLAAGEREPRRLPGIPMPGEGVGSIDAVLGPERLLVGDYSTTTGELTPDGYQEVSTSEPLRVEDVTTDGSLWAVQYDDDADPQFGCSGLYDPAAGEMVARTCETSNLSFSPDDQHLLGMRGDNNMFGDVDVLDLDLTPVTTLDPDGRTTVVSRAGWLDSAHVGAAVVDYRTGSWQLVRVALGDAGSGPAEPEVVVPSFDGGNPEAVAEFVFSG